jgi:hypothetical protein
MVVVADPVIEALAGVGERSEHRVLQKLGPDRFPEPLDLAQGHRVVRGRAHVADALTLEHFLKLGLPTPGRELPAIIGKDLTRRAPLADRALHHLKNGLGGLLAEQAMADDVAGMIVDDTDQVYRIHALQFEGEDVDLP